MELAFYEIKESLLLELSKLRLAVWQKKILLNAVYMDYIAENELLESSKILKKYKNEEDFFEDCCLNHTGVESALALAAQA